MTLLELKAYVKAWGIQAVVEQDSKGEASTGSAYHLLAPGVWGVYKQHPVLITAYAGPCDKQSKRRMRVKLDGMREMVCVEDVELLLETSAS